MDFEKKTQTPKNEKFKFNDHFTKKFDKLAKVYDEKLKQLRSIDKSISHISHGVCNTGYKLRYITPSDISTFVSNLDKSLSAGMIKPTAGDCDMFAVASAKKFIKDNGCVSFGDTNSQGNRKGVLPKGTNLWDLVSLVGNEVFAYEVYTRYEMSERIKLIKEDIKAYDDMHFTAATRSLIAKLPTIIEKHSETACCNCDVKSKEMLAIYVCNFVIFALKLNLMGILQMINYCVPKVTFDTKEDTEGKITTSTVQGFLEMYNSIEDNGKIIQESVDRSEKKPIYFVFSRGNAPILSKAIMKATHSDYSHVGIALETDCRKIYTYTTRGEKHENYVSGETGFGFTIDSINDLSDENIDVAIMVGFIDNDKLEIIKEQIQDFASHKTRFDATLFLNYLRNKPPSNKNKYAQVCSTFCDYILRSADIKVSDEPMSSPGGMKDALDKYAETLNNVFELFVGNSNNYDPKQAEKDIDRFAEQEFSRSFDEMYTECFHFTKIDSEIRSIIPFNCNFRDIVLTDDHEFYKNTECALEYIMTNPRSPFNQLIIQYSTDDCPINVSGEVSSMIRMIFGERLNSCDRYNDPYYRPDVQFPSDPNWMDKITYGNAYYDMNYRRDNPGNYTMDPITTKLDMIHKMFGHCHHETDSSKLVCNIKKIVAIMKAIIGERTNSDEWRMPRTLSTEMLAVFGDILTKTLLKLYHLNTTVTDFSSDMDDTMIPGILYNEEEYIYIDDNGKVVQEALILEDFEIKEMGVKQSDGDKVEKDKAKYNVSKLFAKFQDFMTKIMIKYFPNWEKRCEEQIKWLKDGGDGAKAIAEIEKAIANKTFSHVITNYVEFTIQLGALAKIDPTEAVNAAITAAKENQVGYTGENTSKLTELEKKFYPDEIADEVVNLQSNPTTSTPEAKDTAATNTAISRSDFVKQFILFGIKSPSEKKEQKDTPLTEGMLTKLRTELINDTFTKIGPEFASLLKKLETINATVQKELLASEKAAAETKIKEANGDIKDKQGEGTNAAASKTTEEANAARKHNDAMVQIAVVVKRAEQTFYNASIDALFGVAKSDSKNDDKKDKLPGSWWWKNFMLIRNVVSEYNARKKSGNLGTADDSANNNDSTQAAQTPTNTNANAGDNANANTEQNASK